MEKLTHKDLLKLHGKKITCKIEGEILNAKICVEKHDNEDIIFVCQDKQDGMDARNKMGFKYSWCISSDKQPYEQDNRNVTDIEIIEQDTLEVGKKNSSTEEIKAKLEKRLVELQKELDKTLAEIEKTKTPKMDKYGRFLGTLYENENTSFYITFQGNIDAMNQYEKKNTLGNRFKNMEAAIFAKKIQLRDQVLRKHGAEFPTDEKQWYLDSMACVRFRFDFSNKVFAQQYFETEEQVQEARKELKELKLDTIEPFYINKNT